MYFCSANVVKLRYFIEFSYNGSGFFGYQIQPREITVQEVLQKALGTLLRREVATVGAGRTDTGVHARKMFAHFDAEEPLDTDKLVYRLNSYLPASIAIQRIFQVQEGFHARFEATFRTYNYYISPEKNPFLVGSAWQLWSRRLDIDKMNAASTLLLTQSDFTSFAKLHTDNKTNLCKVYEAQWVWEAGTLKFTITADRFLRNMVRAIVGTLVEVGAGKVTLEGFKKIMEAKDRGAAGASAPAEGLFLAEVGYDFPEI